MIGISLKMPIPFWEILDTESHAHTKTKSQYCEDLIRNGVSINMMLEQAKQEDDKVAQKILGTIIRTGIKKLNPQPSKWRMDSVTFDCDPIKRINQIHENFKKMESRTTTIQLTNDLMEFLQLVADKQNKPISLVILAHIQLSLCGWYYRNSIGDETIPDQEREQVHGILEEIKYSYVEFEFVDAILHVYLQKKESKTTSIEDMAKKTLLVVSDTPNSAKQPIESGSANG